MTATLHPTDKAQEAAAQPLSPIKPAYSVDALNRDHTVRIELPGVPRQDITISLEENTLTVRAKRKTFVPPDARILHRELRQADYELHLRLTPGIDVERLHASLNDGVLSIHLPQRETGKPRQIAVQ